MALQAQSARRVAMGAVLAAVVGTVGFGMVGVGSAESPAPVSAAPVSSAPAAAPVSPVAAAAPEAAAPEPAAPEPAAPEPTAPEPAAPEPAAPEPAAPEPTATPRSVTSTPAPTAEAAPRVPLAAPSALVPGTPCTATAKACADLSARTAWLIEDGVVIRGPVDVMIGDEIDPTPTGTFRVEWKAEAWTSREYLTQMPYSVFFAEGGIAFHEGNQETNSAGCIKLVREDAIAWFKYLQVGDEVQVH